MGKLVSNIRSVTDAMLTSSFSGKRKAKVRNPKDMCVSVQPQRGEGNCLCKTETHPVFFFFEGLLF